MVYDDVLLHPVETASEYDVELDEKASIAPGLYVLRIAERSLQEHHMPKLRRLMKEFEQLQEQDDEEVLENKRKEIYDYMLSADPWSQDKAEALQARNDTKTRSAEDHIELIEEIVGRATDLAIEFEAEEQDAMKQYLAFYRKRSEATRTMCYSAERIGNQADMSVVAMIVGAAHTQRICALLNSSGRPFAVVTPESLERGEEVGDLSWDMVERKYRRITIYSEGDLTKALLRAFPGSIKKPEPVLSEPWFQAKAQLYLFTERIVQSLLGSPGPPGEGIPPFGFNDDDFRTKRIFIDPHRIRITWDTEDGKGRAVLFPVILNPMDAARRKEIWVKAGIGSATVDAHERENVESMLEKALEDIRTEVEPSKVVGGKGGLIQITLNTVAAVGENREAIMKKRLGTI